MDRLRSGDAEIAYLSMGDGPPIVLLHPFPCHHAFWLPAAQALSSRYRLILPDLRGHGASNAGDGPATMEKHAGDVARVLEDCGAGRVVMIGASLGGYILFECWRRYRERIAGLALCCTRPQGDTDEGRANRTKVAEDVLQRGTEPFLDGFVPKLCGATSLSSRPDLVDGARAMMKKMTPKALGQLQLGMAERPDSVPTLATISVPTLVVRGEEDGLSVAADAQLMHRSIAGSSLRVVNRAGHYAPWEQPEEVGRILRQFVDGVRWS
jgi:pimeloyl-ACP methyl ester carboxylesterase